MPSYAGPIDFRALGVPRMYSMRKGEDGQIHERQEVPGNLSPRDFAGVYNGREKPLLLVYVVGIGGDTVNGGHSLFNPHEISNEYLEAWGVAIKSREPLLAQNPPVVLLGEHLMKMNPEDGRMPSK